MTVPFRAPEASNLDQRDRRTFPSGDDNPPRFAARGGDGERK